MRLVPLILMIAYVFTLGSCKTTTTIKERCGDGFIDPGEDCEGADLNDQSCASLGHYNGHGILRCNTDCSFDRSDCGYRCGDETVQTEHGEECDGSNLHGASCSSLGFSGGTLTCSNNCTFDTSGCASRCGNGVLDEGEICDGNHLDNNSCISLGYHGGQLTCAEDCLSFNEDNCVAVGRCGDGIIQLTHGEQCDGENLNNQTCESRGYNPGVLSCSTDCLFDESGCDGTCGDDIIQEPHEECEGANLAGEDCESLGFHPGVLGCTTHCLFDTSGCDGYCGDGIIQENLEDCDSDNLGGLSCRSLGYLFRGDLACDDQCALSGCRSIRSISGGNEHSCLSLADGTAQCWGSNANRQLGDGSNMQRTAPVAVASLENAISISAGFAHTCAVLSDGTAQCWGSNASGQLGDGSGFSSSTPVMVNSLGNAIAISAGQSHTCALLGNGTARCWGNNANGRLGDGTTIDRATPVAVSGLTHAVDISTSREHTCTLQVDGTARCWGRNRFGRLGDGTTSDSHTPVAVSGLTGATYISAGYQHTCSVINDGTARCWGYNSSGQLGDGSTFQRNTPVAVSNLTGAIAISTGNNFSCAVLEDGTARCWGNNASGQLGDNSTFNSNTPVAVSNLTGAIAISTGNFHTCAIIDHGKSAWCWGTNNNGQLGDNSLINRSTPVILMIKNPMAMENFESLSLPQGWSRTGTVWEVGTPTSGPGECAQGSGCAATNLSGNYSNSMAWGSHCLTSGEIFLDGAQGAELQFASWLWTQEGADCGRVQIFTGGSWQNLLPEQLDEPYTHNIEGAFCWSGDFGEWKNITVNLGNYIEQTIRLRFCQYSDDSSTAPGWFIDLFQVTAW